MSNVYFASPKAAFTLATFLAKAFAILGRDHALLFALATLANETQM
jgi:hypothetical protein